MKLKLTDGTINYYLSCLYLELEGDADLLPYESLAANIICGDLNNYLNSLNRQHVYHYKGLQYWYEVKNTPSDHELLFSRTYLPFKGKKSHRQLS